MDRFSQTWFRVRLALVALSVPVWLFIRAAMSDDFSRPPPWHFPFIIGGFTLFGVVALYVLRSDMDWHRPSWTANPFTSSAPLEGVHLSGWSFVVGALGLLAANLFIQPVDWAWVFPGSIGIGFLAGVRVVATG